MDVRGIMARIKSCLEHEDRKDVEFRALIALTELGDIVKYITHDPELNPGARPHGTRKDEALAYGQAIVQALATLALRGIDPEEAIDLGLKNWEEADWRKRKAKAQQSYGADVLRLNGIGIVPGRVRGTVYLLQNGQPTEPLPPDAIVVTAFARPELVSVFGKIVALITDHGGSVCHAANIAREWNVVSAVGTGKATEILKHGQKIELRIPKTGYDTAIEIKIVS